MNERLFPATIDEIKTLNSNESGKHSLLIYFIPISDRVHRAFSHETVNSGSNPDRFKPKTRKIAFHNFPA